MSHADPVHLLPTNSKHSREVRPARVDRPAGGRRKTRCLVKRARITIDLYTFANTTATIAHDDTEQLVLSGSKYRAQAFRPNCLADFASLSRQWLADLLSYLRAATTKMVQSRSSRTQMKYSSLRLGVSFNQFSTWGDGVSADIRPPPAFDVSFTAACVRQNLPTLHSAPTHSSFCSSAGSAPPHSRPTQTLPSTP